MLRDQKTTIALQYNVIGYNINIEKKKKKKKPNNCKIKVLYLKSLQCVKGITTHHNSCCHASS